MCTYIYIYIHMLYIYNENDCIMIQLQICRQSALRRRSRGLARRGAPFAGRLPEIHIKHSIIACCSILYHTIT